MLDKSIPYAEVWMTRPRDLKVTEHSLPEGFSLVFYQEGDAAAWTEIETSVDEFENTKEALAYFNKTFAPHPEELKKRMLFIETDAGEKVGTATAWWKETADGTVYPLVHWVAIKPAFQGKGLSKPLTSKVLQVLQELGEHSSIVLHTQTWSHVAIRLYERFGFEISDKNLDGTPNPDYEKAMEILNNL
ncbi:MAG TPA: GNAT family N-acetyltransferase [Atopostipes sp.]|nr:GNAT family N-acetyltransferase [Atopostipes sp.]